jgi:putative transposase
MAGGPACTFKPTRAPIPTRALIGFLRALKRHFRGQRIVLIWDGLGAHKSCRMRTYLAAQRAWLQVEQLPGYAPDLNPVELLWGNLKGGELANLCPADIAALRHPVHTGCGRIRRQPTLAFASCAMPASGFDMRVTLFNKSH